MNITQKIQKFEHQFSALPTQTIVNQTIMNSNIFLKTPAGYVQCVKNYVRKSMFSRVLSSLCREFRVLSSESCGFVMFVENSSLCAESRELFAAGCVQKAVSCGVSAVNSGVSAQG